MKKFSKEEYASLFLNLYHPTVRSELFQDKELMDSLQIRVDSKLTFADIGVEVKADDFYNAVSLVYDGNGSQIIECAVADGNRTLEVGLDDDGYGIIIKDASLQYDFSIIPELLSNPEDRVDYFQKKMDNYNVSEELSSKYLPILLKRKLSVDEIKIIDNKLKQTPRAVVDNLKDKTGNKFSFDISEIVPDESTYYKRLIGDFSVIKSLDEYTENVLNIHISMLNDNNINDFWFNGLVFYSHSSFSSVITNNFMTMPQEKLTNIFEKVTRSENPMLLTAAFEVGIALLSQYPELESYLHIFVQKIKNDNPEHGQSKFRLLSALVVLIDGEISDKHILTDIPPFLRRLISFTQASLIFECLVDNNIDINNFMDFVSKRKRLSFYLKNMIDLRIEPFWNPDYISEDQLKNECASRIFNSAYSNIDLTKKYQLYDEIFGEDSLAKSVNYVPNLPFNLPGALEGDGLLIRDPDSALLKIIEDNLSDESLDVKSFYALINYHKLYRFTNSHSKRICVKLEEMKYILRNIEDKTEYLAIIFGLAGVASTTRNVELANDVRILFRRFSNQVSPELKAHSIMRIGLTLASTHQERKDWCNFVGEWFTEFAFSNLSKKDAKYLHCVILKLCNLDHNLWNTLGRAESALNSII